VAGPRRFVIPPTGRGVERSTMTWAALAFALGAALLQQQAVLPAAPWLWALPFAAALALWGVLRPASGARLLAVPAALAAGFLWAATLAQLRLEDRLAPGLEGVDLRIVGVVSGLPGVSERFVRFAFEPDAGRDGLRLPRRIRLTWVRAAAHADLATARARAPDNADVEPAVPQPGERWRLTVRLKRPHGLFNPGAFDYEAWLFERGIGATGTVRRGIAGARNERLGAGHRPLDRISRARAAVRARFLDVLGARPAAGILAALAVGDQRAIANEEWRLFQRTGVTHLMSISGLHVTLVSGLVAWLVACGWRRSQAATLRLPARKAAALAAICAALGYTLLAGFAVPAQRTFFMVSVVAAALWSGRIAAPGRTLALALLAVVLADPWAPLAPGFWLSFGAVALIFYVSAGWSAPEPRLVQWLRIQWAITVGLAPAALLLFAQVSVVGPLANAVAIPLVSAIVTPIALVAALLPVDALLHAGAWLVERLLQFLEWCDTLPLAFWQQPAPPRWAVFAALGGVAWLLAPRGVPWRASGVALLAPAFAWTPPAPAQGAAWITTLDVGQGLAVVVRTRRHTLLYDAGPAYGPEADSGGRVILPFLSAQGIVRLDAVMLTHADRDHVGGALSVLQATETDRIVSSLADAHPALVLGTAREPCLRGQRWSWDAVEFRVLHPAGRGARANNLSCVLEIRSGGRAMLLTGDIERSAEAMLVAAAARVGGLRADVLLVPHHGSRTSSSAEFIAAVAPRWAIVPVGYRNRFGHPHHAVLARYRAAGARLLRSDHHGAIEVRLAPGVVTVRSARLELRHYWHAAPPR
jgi:competence protein ComEC